MKRTRDCTSMTHVWYRRDWRVSSQPRGGGGRLRTQGCPHRSRRASLLCPGLVMPLGLSMTPCPGAELAVSLWTGKVKQEPTLYREGPPYQRRGSLQLWQFLVTLLDDPANAHFIAWTGRGMEFKLIEPEEVWGV